MLKRLLLSLAMLTGLSLSAETPLNYEAELLLNGGSGKFAPYYIASNRHGIITQPYDALLDLSSGKSLDLSRRFSYGFGAEFLTGYSSKTDYLRYDIENNAWIDNRQGPPAIFLQQLYGEVKYRGVFLMVGLKEYESALLNFSLSSGDLIESGNSRPIPQVRAGFVDFQKIPFTNGWVEIQGELSYGKMTDNNWVKNHFNYYNFHYNVGALYTYKRCYFRTKSSMPFSVTVGMQTAGFFGGTSYFYNQGKLVLTTKSSKSLKSFLKMFLPTQGEGNSYYDGSTLGSWDIMLRYRFRSGHILKAYLQKPWEDGSGIGWMNGFDGVWGLEYLSPDPHSIVSGAIFEFLDFTNQSGPIHWSPTDSPGTTLTDHATGGDQYYNNYQYNSYMNYGMSIGTPFLPAPLYNLNGYPGYVNNRVRGFHIGLTGHIGNFDYRLLGGYRKGWGDSRKPVLRAKDDTSLMAEVGYDVHQFQGFSVKAQLAYDGGELFGNNFGACISLRYSGLISNLFGK